MPTQFLPSERVSIEEILSQRELLLSKQILPQVLNDLPIGVLILNKTRQTVYFNSKFSKLARKDLNGDLLGLRPGEILGCTYSCLIDGCGTSNFCRYCGAATAIVSGLNGRNDIQECHILLQSNDAIDLMVYANPIQVDGEKFTSFSVIDISAEKRKELLEKVFFHDILNVASGLRGLLDILPEVTKSEGIELLNLATLFVSVLIDEINAQKIITEAETRELIPEYSFFSIKTLINDLIKLFRIQFETKMIEVRTEFNPDEIIVNTDKVILRRVIFNLMKNAIEASKHNSIVNVRAIQQDSKILIKVYNQSIMPEHVKMQVFKRGFSTKGKGRGIGTYSVKLLTESYLNGKISFISEEGFGTEFTVEIPNQSDQ